jgi:hypothetical protein
MATLLAAGAASAAGYVIGSLASKPGKQKHGHRKSKMNALPPLPPLPPPQPHARHLPLIASAPMPVYAPIMTRTPLFHPPRPPMFGGAPFNMAQQQMQPRRLIRSPATTHMRAPPPPPLPLPLPRSAPAAPGMRGGMLSGGHATTTTAAGGKPVRHNDKSSCPLCKRKYESGDVIARMWCEHMVHKACLERMVNRDVVEDFKCNCPDCGSKTYITRFAVAETPRRDQVENTLPGLMPAPENGMAFTQAWDPARVSPVFFGRYDTHALTHASPQSVPAPTFAAPVAHQHVQQSMEVVPVKGIVVTDDLSPLPASATCVDQECTPFTYSLRGGGPSCSLCDCSTCKQGVNCRACGRCVCGNCKGVDCKCACQCEDAESQSMSALSFSENGSVVDSVYTASYNAPNSSAPNSSAPNSSTMFSSISPSMFDRFMYQ